MLLLSLWDCKLVDVTTNFNVKTRICSALLELMIVNCGPCFLPRDISCICFIVVYVPIYPKLQDNSSYIAEQIKEKVNECLNEKPEAMVLFLEILMDFN